MNQYCPACGTKSEENSKFCTTCGYNLEGQTTSHVNNNNNNNNGNTNTNTNYDINNNFTTYDGIKQYTNGMAITGLVISIVSLLLCCGTISWIGLIFSIIGLNKAKQNNGIGKGIAIGGLIANIVGLVLGLFWIIIFSVPFLAALTELAFI